MLYFLNDNEMQARDTFIPKDKSEWELVSSYQERHMSIRPGQSHLDGLAAEAFSFSLRSVESFRGELVNRLSVHGSTSSPRKETQE